MNNITNLLDLEDPDIIISETSIQGQVKTITLETKPVAHFCPSCGLRMYSLISLCTTLLESRNILSVILITS